MNRRNQKESDIVETAATVAVGAAAAYGCYKLCQSMFDSKRPHDVVEQSSANPAPSFGASVSNMIGSMQLAYNGMKLCESLLDALPQEEPHRRDQAARSTQPIQSIRYPDPVQSDRVNLPTRNENKLSGADVVETMQALYGGYKLCQSLFGSDSSNSNSNVVSRDYQQPMFRAVVVETEKNAQEALKKLKEHCNEYKVLGFECEWVRQGNTRFPVSLIQLATHRGYCALFRLNKLQRIPPMLKEILTDPNIIKVSSAPDKDAMYLHDDYGVCVKSTLDLRFMACEAGYSNPGGLTKMSKQFVGIELDESWYIRKSNWNAATLASDQIDFGREKTKANIKLFAFFAEQIAPEQRFNCEAQQLKFIIENHCNKYLNRKYS